MEIGAFSMSCRFRNCEGGFEWMFSRVYGPVLAEEREDFWVELSAIRATMRRFSEVIDELCLKDLPLSGWRVYMVRWSKQQFCL
ncbi:hypothetical protein CK203_030047 [Vitis vinifera]|uniref:Uncharacterized protein n=1 Tax=Vitis vinifera TaxID=29760 RepID=A0A438IK74_VITVI|nr:hypothetical protein CK203_030047 [Vitis vinifera]